MGKFAGSMRQ